MEYQLYDITFKLTEQPEDSLIDQFTINRYWMLNPGYYTVDKKWSGFYDKVVFLENNNGVYNLSIKHFNSNNITNIGKYNGSHWEIQLGYIYYIQLHYIDSMHYHLDCDFRLSQLGISDIFGQKNPNPILGLAQTGLLIYRNEDILISSYIDNEDTFLISVKNNVAKILCVWDEPFNRNEEK